MTRAKLIEHLPSILIQMDKVKNSTAKTNFPKATSSLEALTPMLPTKSLLGYQSLTTSINGEFCHIESALTRIIYFLLMRLKVSS